MFIVLYRWKIKPDHEAKFVVAWSKVTRLLKEERHSLGARLHKGSDGIWYSYAQWPSASVREAAFAQGPVDAESLNVMTQAIQEEFKELVLLDKASYL